MIVATGAKTLQEARLALCLMRSIRREHPGADEVPIVFWDLMTLEGYTHRQKPRGGKRSGRLSARTKGARERSSSSHSSSGATSNGPSAEDGSPGHLMYVRAMVRARVAQIPGVEYRRFPFERFPEHFNTKSRTGGYHAFQPIIVMEHLLEARSSGTPVLWCVTHGPGLVYVSTGAHAPKTWS